MLTHVRSEKPMNEGTLSEVGLGSDREALE
jgi:hypothetical protein